MVLREIFDLNIYFRTMRWSYISAVSSNFWGVASFLTSVVRRKTTVQLGSLEAAATPSEWGPGAKPWKILDNLHSEQLKTFWDQCMNGHFVIFRLINFYTFESLGVSVWDPKLVYRLQNSSGYSTVQSKCFEQTK